jgi:peptidoglycan hydrolase-like protein with peptidoglycan-binding domain
MSDPNTTLDIARSQIGVHSPNNSTPYNIEYGMQGPGAAWCQMFVWWVLSKSGVNTIRTAWTPSGIAYYESQGRWTNGTAGISAGDVVYFDYDNYQGQRTDHVGLVEAVSGGTIQTIEGNVGGGYVKRLWHELDANYIVGYGRPAYDGASSTGAFIPPAPVQTGDAATRDVQRLMQAALLYPGTIDGIYGPQTRAAVTEWQRRLGITADGIWGPQTQRSTDQLFTYLASNNTPTPAPTPSPQVDLAGIADAIRNATRQTIRIGSRGDAVRWLQILLNNAGASLAIDSVFGPQTDAAVRAYQAAHGLTVDGVVGPRTWGALVP